MRTRCLARPAAKRSALLSRRVAQIVAAGQRRGLADIPAAPAFVRYWIKADKGGFWREMICPLMTHTSNLQK